jgi:hypothetical protein
MCATFTSHTVAIDLLLGLGINLAGLGLHIGIGDHGRPDLLVAIAGKLGLERRHRIEAGGLAASTFNL